MYGNVYGNMARMVKTTVYLSDSLKKRVEQAAREEGRPEAEIIRAALDEYTVRHAPRPTLPLFDNVRPVEDWDEAMKGFGKD